MTNPETIGAIRDGRGCFVHSPEIDLGRGLIEEMVELESTDLLARWHADQQAMRAEAGGMSLPVTGAGRPGRVSRAAADILAGRGWKPRSSPEKGPYLQPLDRIPVYRAEIGHPDRENEAVTDERRRGAAKALWPCLETEDKVEVQLVEYHPDENYRLRRREGFLMGQVIRMTDDKGRETRDLWEAVHVRFQADDDSITGFARFYFSGQVYGGGDGTAKSREIDLADVAGVFRSRGAVVQHWLRRWGEIGRAIEADVNGLDPRMGEASYLWGERTRAERVLNELGYKPEIQSGILVAKEASR